MDQESVAVAAAAPAVPEAPAAAVSPVPEAGAEDDAGFVEAKSRYFGNSLVNGNNSNFTGAFFFQKSSFPSPAKFFWECRRFLSYT